MSIAAIGRRLRYQIGAGGSSAARVRRIDRRGYIEREARLLRVNGIHLPVAEDRLDSGPAPAKNGMS